MGSLLNTLWRATILDDAAFQDWRERPNLFLRAIILIIVVSLVAGLLTFAWTLVQRVQPVDLTGLEQLPSDGAVAVAVANATACKFQVGTGLQSTLRASDIRGCLTPVLRVSGVLSPAA